MVLRDVTEERLPIRYGSLVYLSCSNGYIAAEGWENEGLVLRSSSNDSNSSGKIMSAETELLSLLGFERSVFQLIPPLSGAMGNVSEVSGTDVHENDTYPSGVSCKADSAPEVTFGLAFTLLHTVSRTCVAAFPSKPSRNDSDCSKLVLVKPGEVEPIFCEFTFISHYKIHVEGDAVCRGDKVLVRLATLPLFFHTTKASDTLIQNLCDLSTDKVDNGEPGGGGQLCTSVVKTEVNVSEEKAAVFTIERYDVNCDRADRQRKLHHIHRPCVPSGVPVIIYHREHNCVLATSEAAPLQNKMCTMAKAFCRRENLTGNNEESCINFLETESGNVQMEDAAFSCYIASSASGRHRSIHVDLDDTRPTAIGARIEGGNNSFEGNTMESDHLPFPVFTKGDNSASCLFSEGSGILDDALCSCSALWIFENEYPAVGGPVMTQSCAYRLRQACSNLYMAVDELDVDPAISPSGKGTELLEETLGVEEDETARQRCAGVGRATSWTTKRPRLCMIPPPKTEKDLLRTLFTVKPMVNPDCGYLTLNECLVLWSVATNLCVCTCEEGGRLFLDEKPSVFDLMTVHRSRPGTERGTLFLSSQCEWLCRYRDAFQKLALQKQINCSAQKDVKGLEHARESVQEHSFVDIPKSETEPVVLAPNMPGILQERDDILKGCAEPRKVLAGNSSTSTPYADLLPLVHACQGALAQLILFCSNSTERNALFRDGIPIPDHQYMMIELNIHRLIVDVILAPFALLSTTTASFTSSHDNLARARVSNVQWGCKAELPTIPFAGGVMNVNDILSSAYEDIHLVCRLALRLVRQMVRKAPELKAGFEVFIPYFLALAGYGLRVTDMLTVLLSENPSLSVSCAERVVVHYVEKLRRGRSGDYLRPLCSLCSVESHGIAERQMLICRFLLKQNSDLLYHFVLNDRNEWSVITTDGEPPVSCMALLNMHHSPHHNSENITEDDMNSKIIAYIHNELELLACLCLDGSPHNCIAEAQKVFPPSVLLVALRAFGWTDKEAVVRPNEGGVMRALLLRFALYSNIVPRVADPESLLRCGTVLLGSSSLHIRVGPETPISGRPDDKFIRAVKGAALSTIRANSYFARSNTCRSVSLRDSLEVWLQLVAAHQISVNEMNYLVPLLLALLDSKKDVLHNEHSKVADQTRTRLEVSEADLLVVEARETICKILFKVLESITYRAANEIILLLHRTFFSDCGAKNENSDWSEKFYFCKQNQGNCHSVLCPAGGNSSWTAVTEPTERDALLPKPESSCLSGSVLPQYGKSKYQSTEAKADVTETGNDTTSHSFALTSYLDNACEYVSQLFHVKELIPHLVGLVHYGGARLTPLAMDLLVSLCSVRRHIATCVLRVHPLPSAEVRHCFDHLYMVAARIKVLFQHDSIDEAVSLALENIEEPYLRYHAPTTESEGAAVHITEVEGHPYYREEDEEYSGEDSNFSDEEGCEGEARRRAWVHEEGTTTPLAGSVGERERRTSSSRAFWTKAAGAVRMVMYRNTIKERRRELGLSETSRVPLGLVLRAETVSHWGIHLTMLQMHQSLDPASPTFAAWMRFFYIFTLSRNNARSLQARIGVFMDSLTTNRQCTVICLHVILAVLATMTDPTPYLTTAFLRESAHYIEREVNMKFPDTVFATNLGLYIFAKSSVGGGPRRLMLKLLRECNVFRCLPRLDSAKRPERCHFTACIVELLCRICLSSMFVVALGRSTLPLKYLIDIVTKLTTEHSPLPAHSPPRRHPERGVLDLVGANLLAMSTLYIAAGNVECGENNRQMQMEWMANFDWWVMVRSLATQLKNLVRLMKSSDESSAQHGVFLLRRYRRLWLVVLPTVLITFMTSCFNEDGFYRYRTMVEVNFQEMCEAVVQFSEVVLEQARANQLRAGEIVNFRRLVAVLHMKAGSIVNQETLASSLLLVRNRLRHGLLQHIKGLGGSGECGSDEMFTKVILNSGAGVGLRTDAEASSVASSTEECTVFLGSGTNPLSSSGLVLSSTVTKLLEVERLREVLRSFTECSQFVSMKSSTNPNEAAGVVNGLLQRSPDDPNVRNFIAQILDGMRRRRFSHLTLIGLMTLFRNALRSCSRQAGVHAVEGRVDTGEMSWVQDELLLTKTPSDKTDYSARYSLQVILNELGMAEICVLKNELISYGAMDLAGALLDGGNTHAQKALLNYFERHQKEFFYAIRDMLHDAVKWVRRTNAEHQLVILEAGGVVPNVSNAYKYNTMLLANVLAPPPSLSGVVHATRGRDTGNVKEDSGRRTRTAAPGSNVTAHKTRLGWDCAGGTLRQRSICTLFRMLQLFCEGHNMCMQNYLRVQHNNLRSVNSVQELMNLITEISTTIHPATAKMLHSGFDLLTELCQGPCHGNQEALLNCGVCVVICNLLKRLYEISANRGGLVGHGVAQDGGYWGDAPPSQLFGETDTDVTQEVWTRDSPRKQPCQHHLVLNDRDIDYLRLSITQCLLSLIEGCRSPRVFRLILTQIPDKVVERELSYLDPSSYDSVINSKELEDDPGVEAFFNWLIFLNVVRPYAEGAYLEKIDIMLLRTAKLSSRLGYIEVQRSDGLLENVFFRVPQIWRGLTRKIRSDLLWSVNCNSRATKLVDFLHYSDNVIFEVERTHSFQCCVENWTRFKEDGNVGSTINSFRGSRRTGVSVPKRNRGLPWLWSNMKRCWNNSVAPVLFPTQLIFYEYASLTVAVIVNVVLLLGEGVHWHDREGHNTWKCAVAALCIFQLVLSCATLIVDVVVFFPTHLYAQYRRRQHLFCGKAKLNSTLKEVLHGLGPKEIAYSFLTTFNNQFRIFLVAMAVLSIFVSRYFAAAHLLLWIYTTPTLRTFISAITQNGRQLLLTALLGIMVLYLFAIAGFILFPKQFNGNDASGSDDGGNCDTLLRCFTFILWQGVRQGGGVGDVMKEASWKSATFLPRVSYDIIFFALVNIVFLNIMFGIIIDTFGELRDGKRERERDLTSTCFVCGLDADRLEKTHLGGFRAHVKHEHNMWMYLYFMHYLRRKDPNHFTGQESYVHEKIQRNDLSFFPEDTCLALQEDTDSDARGVVRKEEEEEEEAEGSERQGVAVGIGKSDSVSLSGEGSAQTFRELHSTSGSDAEVQRGVAVLLKELNHIKGVIYALADKTTEGPARTHEIRRWMSANKRVTRNTSSNYGNSRQGQIVTTQPGGARLVQPTHPSGNSIS
uniref:Uncharacterized protein n=1 Tax=Trypanosoma vivax (strain Y486) TaxID=1055687 RepID=G0U0L9_TRYVY|nr:conserved hypothetical protein, fragment [Trypanosoma vivax Y486]